MTTVIKGKLLIDGSGSEPTANPVLVVKEGQLIAVGAKEQLPLPIEATLIDLSDKVILPGLIDAHVHLDGWRDLDDWAATILTPVALAALRAAGDAHKLLKAGFTSVRCVGSSASVYLRLAIEEGAIPGPRIKAAGRALCLTSGVADCWSMPLDCMIAANRLGQGWGELVDGCDEIRRAVRRRRREGAEVIKFFSTGAVLSKENPMRSAGYSPEEIRVLVDEAHRQGLKVACHAISTQGIREAVVGGVDTVEHGSLLDDECIDLMIQNGTYLVPTFSVVNKILENPEGKTPEHALRQAQELDQKRRQAFAKAYQAGVKIACGSDCTGERQFYRFGENAVELLSMVEAGMKPMDAIVAATGHAADAIGMEDAGIISVGKRADLIAVDDNPLENMNTLLNVSFVMQDGKVIKDQTDE